MRSLVLALALGLTAPLPVLAQSVTLDVCNTGAIDIDVFVSQSGAVSPSHIPPSTCAAVAKKAGDLQQAYVGIAFTDSRGQWGAPRRFDRVPEMGSRKLLQTTKLATALKGEKPPQTPILSAANQSASVRHGNATVTLPLQLNFQPSVPECRTLPVDASSNTIGRETSRTTFYDDFCEDLHYTLLVEAYADSHEAMLSKLLTGGAFANDRPLSSKMEPLAEVDWPEITADRKLHAAPEPITWNDLVPSVDRAWATSA